MDDDPLSFELHRTLSLQRDKRSSRAASEDVVRLACPTEEDKNNWVAAINSEIRKLWVVQQQLENPQKVK